MGCASWRESSRRGAKMGTGPVSCQSCGHENPAGARFCNDCGAPLAAPTITPEPRSYTPRHLVEKILASQSALRGERKLVTVLFADVVRSMELAERVDPEEWHRLLDRLFRILAGGVHRYEATINQYTGDGIMALFGAPIAHEDHAQRACAAALDLARELGARLLALRRPRARARSAREGSARDAVGSTEGRPGYRGAGRGKEPPLSRVRRARPRRGASLCPRALPRTHASLSRDGRACAQSLRCRRRRAPFRRPGRCETRSRERAARPDRPGFLARPSRGVRSRPCSFRTRSRSAPHTSFPVASRADPGSRSARAHVALGRGPALARPGERSGAGDAHRVSPGHGVSR